MCVLLYLMKHFRAVRKLHRMGFAAAGAGEVLRSVQKDDFYSRQLSQLAASLGLDVLGPASWVSLDQWVEPAIR